MKFGKPFPEQICCNMM